MARLLAIPRGSTGFGFHLHCEKGRTGQFIRSVDDAGNAQRAGLRPGDRVIEVDGLNIDGLSHQQVVARIRGGEITTTLLVVDMATDEWYKQQGLPIITSEEGAKSSSRLEAHVTKASPPAVRNVSPSPAPGDQSPGLSAAAVRAEMMAALPQGKKKKSGHSKGGWAARAAAFDQL